MKFSLLLKMIRFWPPFWGAGISVKKYHLDGTYILVQMKMRFWNKNYVGTHFGGSMYSMTDPFYMLMLMNLLGKGYIVWDKSASIRYKIPAKGTLYAQFKLTPEHVEKIRLEVNEAKKIESEFMVPITDEEGKVVAEVKKILSIIKK
ncbi:Uncharacterised protein [Legionella wadsworthii]|uniref:Tetrameric acyl-CoA thioesterase n=1 Tax=Legionella wadsworthii TaxID=28088 RepID=A0A378LTH8_9GAMM|nr:DUF4442 domain-containing protein [Legionella wadsworthii]STY30073.1 Uncharacterised protein [Legionella wadsworthii]